MSAKCSPPMRASADLEDRALAVAELRGGELVGLEDRHDAVDAGLTLQVEALDARVLLDVADRADHRDARAMAADGRARRRARSSLRPSRSPLGCGLLHDDHHSPVTFRRPSRLDPPSGILNHVMYKRSEHLHLQCTNKFTRARALLASVWRKRGGPGRTARWIGARHAGELGTGGARCGRSPIGAPRLRAGRSA